VLYGMGWKTDLSAKAGIYRYYDDARQAFARIAQHGEFAIRALPSNRELVNYAHTHAFGPQGVAA